MNGETGSLKLSAWMSLLMGLLGVGFAIWSASGAILLDGLFSLVNLVASLFTIRVAQLVRQAPDARLHFGYSQFEPFLNVVKSLVVVALCTFATFEAVDALIHGGRELEPGPALIYALVAMAGGFIVSRIQGTAAKRTNSPLLEVEARSWLIDGLLSGVVAVAFGVTVFLERNPTYVHWVPYVDPALVISLILIVIWVPLRIILRGVRELLAFAPDRAEQEEVRGRVQQALAGFPVAEWHARMHRTGRYFYLMTQVRLEADARDSGVDEQDAVRDRIAKAMDGHHTAIVMDTIFTKDQRWIE